jgi:beta-glucanase (GH16 family)
MGDHVLSEPPGWSLVWSDEVVWEPDRIRWYLDDQLYRTLTPGDLRGNPWVFDHDFFLLVNVAVGGSFSQRPDSSTLFRRPCSSTTSASTTPTSHRCARPGGSLTPDPSGGATAGR